jgi:transposase
VVCLLVDGWVLVGAVCEQEYCKQCGVRSRRVAADKHHLCSDCNHRRRYESTPVPSSSTSSLSPPISLFNREPSSSHHLTEVERAAAVTLRRLGETQQEVADQLGTTRQAVARWENRYEEIGQVHEGERSGRPRETTELDDEVLVAAAVIQPFTTPRQLKRKLNVDVSPRTIDRRLIEAGLPGRVAVHAKDFTDEDIRKRLSFAQGYKDWTEEQWERVVFSDEKKFLGKGFSGRVWVRRPPGEALNPEYYVDKKPHPVKVNMWGCFSGHGLGYSYLFNESLDAKLLKHILSTHLLSSAQLHFQQHPPEQWWFLQDNDPKHSSREIRSWLHNNGVSCLDFPPYSPDLNPMENLWNDIARRVEQREAETMEQLQDVVAEEWAATSTDLLAKLAHSMPKRCKAVIDAQGGHTHY